MNSSEDDACSTFIEYLDTFDWAPGNRNRPAYLAFLRAATLGVSPQTALNEVTARIQRTGGSVNVAKLQRQQARAFEFVLKRPLEPISFVPSKRLEFSPEQQKAVASRAPSIDANWLRSNSPVSVTNVNSTRFLDLLYDRGEKVLIFTDLMSQGQMTYEIGAASNDRPPSQSTEGVWFLVNPVDGIYHPNPRQNDKPSRRSEESITSWRYMVLESDVGTAEDWLRVLVQLPIKLSAIYTSGRRSLHALVRLDAPTKADWDRQRNAMKPVLVPLGADEGALSAVRLSRLPGAYRGETLQELLYLDPTPNGRPLVGRTTAPTKEHHVQTN